MWVYRGRGICLVAFYLVTQLYHHMSNVFKSVIGPKSAIYEAIKIIDTYSGKIALVVGDDKKLIGTITDGDVRRGLLRGVSLDSDVSAIVNIAPRCARVEDDKSVLLNRMRSERLRHLPILDQDGRLAGLETLTDLIAGHRKDNWVVIMAGGEGRRLRPLTNHLPKPMLSVGSKPLLETIVNSFVSAGFYKVYLSVNYKADLVAQHFGDGTGWGAEISYLRENSPLGTAGSLTLLPEIPTDPCIVMNGDILTKVDFDELLNFHRENGNTATMCVREHCTQVPYGVVEIADGKILSLREKPVLRNLVNAGIYVFNPEVFELLEPNTSTQMPTLFDALIKKNLTCGVWPIREYWIDVGQFEDLQKANDDIHSIFSD